MWTNIIDNVLDAMDGAGTLRIGTRTDAPGVERALSPDQTTGLVSGNLERGVAIMPR